ncbi:MAG: cytochrome P460 family protein [Trueperaceae bacterium]|nr:cytochrome P460 family protein [Trueperaceae bacterium]
MPRPDRLFALTVLALLTALLVTLVAAQDMMGPHRPEYADWTRLNPQKNFIVSAHPTAKDIYINDAGRDAALERSFPYPDGSELVKESIDVETLNVTVITAMRKVAGFDPANGDWEYGMFERMDDGSFGGMWAEVGSDMHQMCVGCHTGAAATDYTFLTYTGN